MHEPAGATPRRSRRWLLAAAAVGGAAAGAGFAVWRLRPGPADAAALEQLWTLHFETPDGGPLPMAGFRGKPLLVNFWATWCPPCVEEMPLLDAFHRQRQASGWQVLGLAVDQPGAVRRFLAQRPVGFPIGMAGLAGTDLSRSLGNTAGGLPFSILVDADGRLRERKMGQLHEADLRSWAAST